MSRSKNIMLNLLLAFFILSFIVSGYLLYKELMVYKAGSDEYNAWVEKAVSVQKDDSTLSENSPFLRVVDFAQLENVNSEVIGWIYIPDTIVDYPVVQTKDNDKYLNTLFSGESNKAGAIFADYRNKMDFFDDNTILYGHNMKNKSMFHILQEYKKQDFYDKHKTMYYYSPDGIYELRIFSAYTIHATDPYTTTNYGEDRSSRISELEKRSNIKPAFVVGPDDKIITLSTCTYDYDDARFVVHATVHKSKFGGGN